MDLFFIVENIGIPLLFLLIGVMVRKTYVDWIDNRKSKLIKPLNQGSLDINILENLRVGMSLENIKFLGVPYKKSNVEANVFKDNSIQTNSYLYIFNNAHLKITSIDNQKIDSISLFPKNKKFDFRGFDLGLGLKYSKFNKAKVNKKLIDESEHTLVMSRHDHSFALKYTILNPFYIDLTFFGDYKKNWHEYFDTKNPNLFVGEVIGGICISASDSPSFFIYNHELH